MIEKYEMQEVMEGAAKEVKDGIEKEEAYEVNLVQKCKMGCSSGSK